MVEGLSEWDGAPERRRVPRSGGPTSATAPLRETPECRRAPVGSKLSLFASPVAGRGPGALELSTGGRPVSIHDELLVVSALVAAATLRVCMIGF